MGPNPVRVARVRDDRPYNSANKQSEWTTFSHPAKSVGKKAESHP